MATAKVFWSGRSQAVRLQKEFRVEGDEVRIRRQGSNIILEPIQDNWAWLDALVRDSAGLFDEEFIQAVEEDVPMQERPELDNLP
jgi:antitoxin VapB